MSDIDLSLARLAADAEEKRAALEVENEALQGIIDRGMEERNALRSDLAAYAKERDLLEQERDTAIHEAERWQRKYLIATGQGDAR